ncbi:MAG: Fe-S cluster domain-containing protein [Clostridiales Family XIII bacterium]|nr:Fe-S cluster domain-containing protein [Clostridiales Family XIII bacterium]
MLTAFVILLIMGFLGTFFGFILAFANKKFSVETNPLIHLVEEVLPKGQCGACGYAGCIAYAEAVVLDPAVPPDLCIPGKAAVARLVAELTGKAAASASPRLAHIRCAGDATHARLRFRYGGIRDCVAASYVQGGPKACKYSCIGFGTCVKNCPFGALRMGEDGLPRVDSARCTGCGVCEKICPKKVIRMLPAAHRVRIDCNSNDRGAIARKLCDTACIACGICAKHCPHGAITVENNLAVADARICAESCTRPLCVEKCPTKAIAQVPHDPSKKGVG